MPTTTLAPKNWRAGVVETRSANALPSTYDAANHTVEVILSTGASVARWWGTESLLIADSAIDTTRVVAGQVKIIDSHNTDSIRHIIATVLSTRVESGQLIGVIKFAQTEIGQLAEGMVERGELSGLSIGYTVEAWEVSNPDTAQETWVATRWSLLEGTFCSVPADLTAMVRAATSPPDVPSQPEPKENRNMPPETDTTVIQTPPVAPAAPAVPETRAVPAPVADALSARDTLEILEFARSVGVDAEIQPRLGEDGMTKVRAMELVCTSVAAKQSTATAPVVAYGQTGQVLRDAQMTEGEGITEALLHRMTGGAPSEKARPFAGYRLLDLIAHRAQINSRDPSEIMRRASHTSSDFPLLLEAAANKFMLARYAFAAPTYRQLAKKVEFKDFKPHKFLRVGEFPQLQDVSEGGEIKSGTFGENREQASAKTRGVILMLSRQMLVNDDMGAFSELVSAAGMEAARTENAAFFTLLNANGVLSDNVALFHANHANLLTAAAITTASLALARAAMRKQTGVDKVQILSLAPSILLVGPDKETEAEQYTSATNQNANDPAKYNPFSGKLEVVCDANITGNPWYTLCNPEVAANFIYGYVGGVEGPQLTQVQPFNIDGVGLKVLHDFGVGQNDFRAWQKNPGA